MWKIIPRIEAKNIEKRLDILNFFGSCELAFWKDFPATKENLEFVSEVVKGEKASPYSIHVQNFKIFNELEKQLLEETLKFIAKKFPSVKIVVMHCLYKRKEKIIDALNTLRIPEYLSLAIENLRKKGANIRTPEDAVEFFKNIRNSNVVFCLDISHIPRKEDENSLKEIFRFLEMCRNFLKHIHISDFNKRENHLPIGYGIVDWYSVVKKVKEIKYSGVFVLELGAGYDKLEIFRESSKLLEKLFLQ